ncbi:uncharacterized protein PV09_05479 [Verruconis gallopava]|uniref:RRM domain-containing protein n=1 Tax=Verruconis gallopava TaxID=253628 RepID=A0A0D2AVR9_9PEZI|nr:uncharacterized protein PV09_05479 [Verruconis gallopava]KIW03259.1 hypothetical protein PV09_05479 [Verruconis gallopava]
MSTAKAAPSKSATGANPPNQTLYISNLPDKLQKSDLRRNLYYLFTAYGPVLDINAQKTMKMRGQAFVVFRDTSAAVQALRSLQGFEFFGKEMKIQYAKSKSDTIAKLDGTYKIPASALAGSAAAGAATGERSELQQSIFSAPPGSSAAKEPELPKKVEEAHAGVKRPREEEEDEPMEEDDEGAEMEMDESD